MLAVKQLQYVTKHPITSVAYHKLYVCIWRQQGGGTNEWLCVYSKRPADRLWYGACESEHGTHHVMGIREREGRVQAIFWPCDEDRIIDYWPMVCVDVASCSCKNFINALLACQPNWLI